MCFMSCAIFARLQNLDMIGKLDKRKTYWAGKGHDILLQEVINNELDWEMKLTVAKIKAFFQLTLAKMNRAAEKMTLRGSSAKLLMK